MSDPLNEALSEAGNIVALLERLVPPDGGEVTDLLGNSYPIPKKHSARKQLTVGRLVDGILKMRVSGEESAKISLLVDGENQADAIMEIASFVLSEEVERSVEKTFLVAYPKICKLASSKVADAEGYDGGTGPLDLFEIEEIVRAFAPFLIRPARKLMGLLNQLPSETS